MWFSFQIQLAIFYCNTKSTQYWELKHTNIGWGRGRIIRYISHTPEIGSGVAYVSFMQTRLSAIFSLPIITIWDFHTTPHPELLTHVEMCLHHSRLTHVPQAIKNRSEQQHNRLVRGHLQQYRDEIRYKTYSTLLETKVRCCALSLHRAMDETPANAGESDRSYSPSVCSGWDLFDLPTSGPEKKGAHCLGGYEIEEYSWNTTKSTFNKQQTKKSSKLPRVQSMNIILVWQIWEVNTGWRAPKLRRTMYYTKA